MKAVNVAVVGATSVIAEALLEQMEEISFPVGKLFLLDDDLPAVDVEHEGEDSPRVSSDSGLVDDAEDDVDGGDESGVVTRLYANRPIAIQEAKHFDYSQVQLVLFVGSLEQAQRESKRAVDAKCLIVDGSGAFRLSRDVPLVVAGVNDAAIAEGVRLVASPSALTVQLAAALQPLCELGLERVDVTALMAVSELGKQGLDELAGQNIRLMNGLPVDPVHIPERIAYNIVPQVGAMVGESGYAAAELAVVAELRQVLAMPALPVAVTCLQVPVFYGHSASLSVKLASEQKVEALRKLFNKQTDVELLDKVGKSKAVSLPTPLYLAEQDPIVYVGRLRMDLADARLCHYMAVADNIRKGAAVNILQLALVLLKLYP